VTVAECPDRALSPPAIGLGRNATPRVTGRAPRAIVEVKCRGADAGGQPGGPSRWSTERSGEWEPLAPRLVAEVAYDHFSAGRFRHGTQFIRWRPDKAPRQCTIEQVARHGGADMRPLRRLRPRLRRSDGSAGHAGTIMASPKLALPRAY
jgi:hypothetical protein